LSHDLTDPDTPVVTARNAGGLGQRSCEFLSLTLLHTHKILGLGQWSTQEFCSGGVQQNHLGTEDTENGDLETVAPLIRGSGSSCKLVQEISYHIIQFS